jgi:hypothetical protein
MFLLLKIGKQHVQKFCCTMVVTYCLGWKIQYPSQITRLYQFIDETLLISSENNGRVAQVNLHRTQILYNVLVYL